jgi:2-polyprenyl-6-methoxyphenol hydroxylase-like FAD-dependent oxidoreductase
MSRTTAQPSSLLIVGGGVGGLACALAVAQTGGRVHLLEQAPAFGEVGAGIQLGPNATAVLDRLGVLEALSQDAVFPNRVVLMDAVAETPITALDVGASFRERYGHPYLVAHRVDLHRVLLDACREHALITLETGKTVTAVEDLIDGARVTCADGSVYEAEALVGADGLWSTVRRLLSDDEPVCSRYVAYRGTLPMTEATEHAEIDDVVMWAGPDMHLVQYPVRRGELYNNVAVFKSPSYIEGSDDWGGPEELDACFGALCPGVRDARGMLQRQRRWPMFDALPIGNWTRHRITLLGDAAHPMLQYLAQGGCQALEDAVCLADHLDRHDDAGDAFVAYQQERIPRTARVQTTARTWGEVLHVGGIGRDLRNTLLAERRDDDFGALDWLYGHRQPTLA